MENNGLGGRKGNDYKKKECNGKGMKGRRDGRVWRGMIFHFLINIWMIINSADSFRQTMNEWWLFHLYLVYKSVLNEML